jgi:hypothetical protein
MVRQREPKRKGTGRPDILERWSVIMAILSEPEKSRRTEIERLTYSSFNHLAIASFLERIEGGYSK